MSWAKKGPAVPAMTSNHQMVKGAAASNVHGHVAVRHPGLPGPNMMAAKDDYMELPSGAASSTPPGGAIGGLAPFQSAKGAMDGDFQAPNKSAKTYSPPPALSRQKQ
jgi:hypothetical protein